MNTKIVMINASPRIEKNSNTDKIIEAFGQGLLQGLPVLIPGHGGGPFRTPALWAFPVPTKL